MTKTTEINHESHTVLLQWNLKMKKSNKSFFAVKTVLKANNTIFKTYNQTK